MNVLAVTDVQIRGSPERPSAPPEAQASRPAPAVSAAEEAGKNAPQPEPSEKEVQQAAEGVNAFLRSGGSHVQFAFHRETKRMMVQVVDDRTQEVIKTIPAKELLDLSAKIGEVVGLFLDKKG